jgi:hypothetical protein
LHTVQAGNYVLEGIVIICWDLIGVDEHTPNEDGPVTWCRGRHVITARTQDETMALLKENFPITSPRTFFKCYHATSNYRIMFSYIPDTTSWKFKYNVGIDLLILYSIIEALWNMFDLIMKKPQPLRVEKLGEISQPCRPQKTE